MLLADRRLRQLENTALDLAVDSALRQARMQPREDFARAYLDALPAGPLAGQVQADLDALTVHELWALARSGDASLPDIEGWSPGQLRELAMEHA